MDRDSLKLQTSIKSKPCFMVTAWSPLKGATDRGGGAGIHQEGMTNIPIKKRFVKSLLVQLRSHQRPHKQKKKARRSTLVVEESLCRQY